MRAGWIFAWAVVLGAAGIARAATSPDWRWLFPMADLAPARGADDRATLRIPGSGRTFRAVQLHDMQHAVDWFPNEHPTTPRIVSTGHGAANACGFCHLPDGNGRPENAALAGLPADYIKRQVLAFANGSRHAVMPMAAPTALMAATASAATPAEVEQAAGYFSKLHYTPHVRVVEMAAVAFRPGRFVYLPGAGPKQPIGDRIIEVPTDPARFEARDPHQTYIAYVSPGSIARGRAIALSGGAGGQSCTLCHGRRLEGGIAPPLAGRSPTMLIRQLAAFATGARHDAGAAPMRVVAAKLKQREIVDVAAYAATLRP